MKKVDWERKLQRELKTERERERERERPKNRYSGNIKEIEEKHIFKAEKL